MKNELPIVSICMLTYNHENYIKQAIDGVLNQVVEFQIELVIADDLSKDKTCELVDYYVNTPFIGKKVNFIKNKRNLGVAANFKNALESCNGKYISLCEGDDVWNDPFKLEKQVRFLESNVEFIGSFHDSHFIDLNGNLIFGTVLSSNAKRNLNFNDFISGNITLTTQTVMFRNLFQKLPNQLLEVENPDIFLYTYLSTKGGFYFHNNIVNSYYRHHGTSYFSSRTKFQRVFGNRNTFEKMRELYPSNLILETSIFNQTNSLIVYSLKTKKYKLFFLEYSKNLIKSFSNFYFLKLFMNFHLKTPIKFIENQIFLKFKG